MNPTKIEFVKASGKAEECMRTICDIVKSGNEPVIVYLDIGNFTVFVDGEKLSLKELIDITDTYEIAILDIKKKQEGV